jgi:hypothetical protein
MHLYVNGSEFLPMPGRDGETGASRLLRMLVVSIARRIRVRGGRRKKPTRMMRLSPGARTSRRSAAVRRVVIRAAGIGERTGVLVIRRTLSVR